MNKRSLGGLAIVLIAMMAIVSMAGLDRLPRDVKRSVEVSASRVKSDRTRFNDARAGVNSAIGAEPELFRTQAALWQARLLQADEKLKQTEVGMARLLEIEKANKRGDAPKLEEGIRQLEAKRAGTVEEALNLRSEADRWLGYKRNLPQQISEMKSNYEAVHGFDIAREASAANKAMTDWPSKKADLESRTRTLEVLKQQAEEAWTSTAEARAKAESNNSSGIDYSMLFAAGEAIRGDLKELQRGTATMNALASQLYVGRDKVLLDIDDDHGIKEKVRIVETKYTDAALSNPQPTSKEVWEDVDSGRLADLKKSIGMVVERKPPGKYDSEVEKTLQAPGYAYIAPPGQANQYGGWNNGVWSWLPQYLIMSQLLRSNHGPMTHGDYYGYDSARRRG
ncbi:MAG: hypothetical protein H7Y20_07080, partial [Bryobacteraceae bacterium]|nr:hypothetical protein [Bryobacteraceae bacterium]